MEMIYLIFYLYVKFTNIMFFNRLFLLLSPVMNVERHCKLINAFEFIGYSWIWSDLSQRLGDGFWKKVDTLFLDYIFILFPLYSCNINNRLY